ncbi:GNAT family N-acetyltransferase [Dactylosporangium aurantiacum]|uniref:GNAT family N-acetyltransferase n=1 Tax=Dactylosporangium aurantiacum TaxID=35754 RepID=A0A9Q9IPK4_9ACTN|nr:GCN5 family acetyltransferase [Dactylosporangium aurantiacum]MDG6104290.1 GNAT family N-acetyltransferase [Dactylosporangium aurantiacum]UWZ56713.1 GNAT family N-acetyltransferase [Dactylosporangium aurantiacum]
MDAQQVLALFDRKIRQEPRVGAGSGTVVEREPGIVRVVSSDDGWHGVAWCDLHGLDADAVIAAQVQRFGQLGQPWEWKHYSYDRPEDLPERLLAAGFEPDPVEGLLFAEVADLPLEVDLPAGTRLEPVTDAAGVALVVAVHDEVFGGDHSHVGKDLAARLAERPDGIAAAVVMAGDRPICAGRIEFHGGTEFASLWGGGTVAQWRGRGVFRALVAHRAALAAAAGYRYLQVDASADSRPILRRLGFQQLATTTPFVRNP